MENTESRRVKMTKRIIKDAFLDLLEKKSINHISIKEICDLADINRSTFYAHYQNQYDLYNEIENDIINVTPRINLYQEEPVEEELRIFFKFIEDNKRECVILFKNSTGYSFETKILDKIFGKTKDKPQWITDMNLKNPLHVKMLMSAFGGLMLIEKWILGEIKSTPDELADVLSKYISNR